VAQRRIGTTAACGSRQRVDLRFQLWVTLGLDVLRLAFGVHLAGRQ
jgi:hypothetical protein